MTDPRLSPARRFLFAVFTVLVLPLLALAFVEGAASLILLGRDLTLAAPPSERRHTEYDALLGWIHRPDLVIPDMYGPGADLRINAQRFRANEPTAAQRTPGRRRAICAGDSFTLGYGVGNDATWCHLLAAGRTDLETVNMGQAGYGIDQAYLWYQRDGAPIEHDILIFAFITEDFRRAAFDTFEGYPKPLLRVHDGGLLVSNVPVPRPRTAGLAARYLPPFTRLRMSELLLRLRLLSGHVPDSPLPDSTDHVVALADWIVHDLAGLHNRARTAVLVHLPTFWDHGGDNSLPWRTRLRTSAEAAGVPYIDLIEEIRRLPIETVEGFFAHDHYNEAGNRWIADVLLRRLEPLLD